MILTTEDKIAARQMLMSEEWKTFKRLVEYWEDVDRRIAAEAPDDQRFYQGRYDSTRTIATRIETLIEEDKKPESTPSDDARAYLGRVAVGGY